MKKIVSFVMLGVLAAGLAACGGSEGSAASSAASAAPAAAASESAEAAAPAAEASDLKVGVILLHDETIGYDYAHYQGVQTAMKNVGLSDSQVVFKYNIAESEQCYDAAIDLVEQGCNVIISDSYGHQSYMTLAAEENPDVTFLIATGDTAAVEGLDNTHNFFTHTYESRYVSGVVAGMKLAEMVENNELSDDNYNADGTIKIGYVGAYPYAEVVSGYTGFYLGVKSVVDNVAMDVTYTNSWADATAEQQAAEFLLGRGCCIISQHADSTGGPAAIEAAIKNSGAVCYYVGYNIDMLSVAPTAILTSAQNDWSVYYTYALGLAAEGKMNEIPVDWSEGYDAGANMISPLGESCADGTAEKVAEVEAAIADGTLQVFDTSTFTVDGAKVDSHIFNTSTMNSDYTAIQYEGEDFECITDGAFTESVVRSAPYFDLRIDGITELS